MGAGLRVRWCLLARQPEALPGFYDAMPVVRFSFGSGYLPGELQGRQGGRPLGQSKLPKRVKAVRSQARIRQTAPLVY